MQPITGKTKLLGIIGDPVEHSLSPVMQNAAITHLGVDYIYVPFPVKPQHLAEAIAALTVIGVVGFNLTIPHKQTIMPLLNQLTPEAKLVGAVNTVWRDESGWCGTNTDVVGFIAPLQDYSLDWPGIQPIILGNGGAARAVVVGCAELGCTELHVVGRNSEKLAQFQASWSADATLPATVNIHPWKQLSSLLSSATLIVNTTPIGMAPQVNQSPLSPALIDQIPQEAIIYDLIYTPQPTPLLQYAQQRGIIAIDGLDMLMHQGAAALKIWIQHPIPTDIMMQALQQQLQAKDR